MDSKRVSETLGISYGQLNYLLRKINSLTPVKWGASQGKARVYTCHDLTRLRLALQLKHDGYSTKAIQKAVNELNKNWNGKTPDSAGVLFSMPDNAFMWTKEGDTLEYVPNLTYNVRKVAGEVYDKTP